ncbi:hypothetical protein COCNU_09G002330 [Cocos nucifera]|uniref:Leucine zipper homeobox-associated domain-containing protein n=1 Tax=Cocos nucifera TaxID=13894 RepID=A0A8K0IJI2_COCNU|nr:hypothetical protein COCNU_09G002330 [Cocos nucifera]
MGRAGGGRRRSEMERAGDGGQKGQGVDSQGWIGQGAVAAGDGKSRGDGGWGWGGWRTKLKQTEVDCEYLKRWCERLTEENRRLQKEVAELRALKLLSPMQMPVSMMPPTTLTMCPSCQRVISPSNSSNSSTTTTATAATSSSPANHQHHHLFPGVAHSNPTWAMAPFRAAYLNQSS